MKQVILAPGAIKAGIEIKLPPHFPPIRLILDCFIFRGSDGKTPATIMKVVATKVDKNTITLNSDTTTRDLLILNYVGIGELGQEPF